MHGLKQGSRNDGQVAAIDPGNHNFTKIYLSNNVLFTSLLGDSKGLS